MGEEASVASRASELLLARIADVTFLLDVTTGLAVDRWYDPKTSRMRQMPGVGDRLVNWVHPDDLPDVLRAFADVMHDGGTQAALVRLRTDAPDSGVRGVIRLTDVRDVLPDIVLVHAWVIASGDSLLDGIQPVASLSSLAAAAPVGLQVRNAMGDVSFENDRWRELTGTVGELVEAVVDDAIARDVVAVEDVHSGDVSLRVRVLPRNDNEGRLVLAVVSVEDTSQLRKAEADRDEAARLFQVVFDASPLPTALIDAGGCFVRVNESFTVLTGHLASELADVRFQDVTHDDDGHLDVLEILEGPQATSQVEMRIRHRAGHDVWVEVRAAPVAGPDGAGHVVLHLIDISSRRVLLESVSTSDDLAYWASHDHLTGLPNRRQLDAYLDAYVGRFERLVVLFVDLDDFKPVNDLHGHQVGDAVLRTIARRLRNACRDDDLVTRYGGDEFVVVSRALRTAVDVSLLSDRLTAAICTPIERLHDTPISVGASIGVALARPGDDPAALLERADQAAMRAKLAKRRRAPAVSPAPERRVSM